MFGVRLSALACALMVQYRLSKRLTQRLLADMLHIDISLGMLPKLGAETGEALAAPEPFSRKGAPGGSSPTTAASSPRTSPRRSSSTLA